jgi:hypothetical protein
MRQHSPSGKPLSPQLLTWAKHQSAAAALRTLRSVLDPIGIPYVPVKGVVLARWLYDDVAVRPIQDVDVLVSPRDFARAREALTAIAGFPSYRANELGELGYELNGITVEIHAEVGRREFTRLDVPTVLSRCTVDHSTFGFPIQRIDDIDHFILLAVNVIKDCFVYAMPHLPEDLKRLIARIDGRVDQLVDRAHESGFSVGVWLVCSWMAENGGDPAFADLAARLGQPQRRLFAHVACWARRSSRLPKPMRFALACMTTDDTVDRLRALARGSRRYIVRRIGIDPG